MEKAIRLPTPEEPGDFPEGFDRAAVCYWKTEGGTWFLWLPGGGLGTLVRHEVTEHEDGTITASPSIVLIRGSERTRHGFLRRGVWEPCGDDRLVDE